jgi:ketosteroid isomerase-like protein
MVVMMAVGSLAALGQTAGKGGGPDGKDARAVLGLEHAYADAIAGSDPAGVARILADDFVATSSRGEMRSKAAELDDMKPSPDYVMEGFNLDDINVRVFGSTAVATGRSTLKVAYKGQSNTSVFRYTRVYVKRRGRWQAVAQQLTRLPQQQ